MPELTKMQSTRNLKENPPWKGLIFSQVLGEWKQKRREEATSSPKKHCAMLSAFSFMCWGTTGANSQFFIPSCEGIGSQCNVVWLGYTVKNAPAECFAGDREHGALKLANRECCITGLAKPYDSQ